jgi:hypothetical protein
MATSGVNIKGKGFAEIQESMERLLTSEVLVGFPEDGTPRDKEEDEKGEPPTNAVLGYIHDNGAPEVNIPARPFMQPGIMAVENELADLLGKTMKAILKGGGDDMVELGLTRVGFKAMNSIKRTINAGVPPPLSDATLINRMRKGRRDGAGARKGAARELDRRWDGQAPSVEFAKPLVDTGQLRNAVTYVIRPKKRG